jgi:hypothetical protein
MDEAAMKRGSDVPEVVPPMLGVDYTFQPMPQHLEEAAAAAEAAGLPGLMDWGAVALVRSGGRWTFTAGCPGKALVEGEGTWWSALAHPVGKVTNDGAYELVRKKALGQACAGYDFTDPWWVWQA